MTAGRMRSRRPEMMGNMTPGSVDGGIIFSVCEWLFKILEDTLANSINLEGRL